MADMREMPRMCVEGDFLSVYECNKCGAVVRDPDTHERWHATRPWQHIGPVNDLVCECGRRKPCRHCNVNISDGRCHIAGCTNHHVWLVPSDTLSERRALGLCEGHMNDIAATASNWLRYQRTPAAEDIVTRLRGWVPVELIGNERLEVKDLSVCLEAADEIERLRAAGDALADATSHTDDCDTQCGIACTCGIDAVVALWQEVRRG